MPASNLARNEIVERFDHAARDYDAAAKMQRQSAERLVELAARRADAPRTILDIGSGTGFVSTAAAKIWPRAQTVALDASPAMLRQVRNKLPRARLVEADVAIYEPDHPFDLILSSMALHWFRQPRAMLERWRGWLAPQGALHVALLVKGSFQNWQDLCARANIANGLWPLPSADFASGVATATQRQSITIDYPSAEEFLRNLKLIGASSPRPGYKPLSAPIMRRLLENAPCPFAAHYEVLHVMMAQA